MKIDLYNNHETYIKELRHDWNIGRWLKGHGVTVEDLDKHPHINDVILLINIRQNYWHIMTASDQGVWAAYWGLVYSKQKALRPKAWKKIEVIVEAAYQRHLKINIIKHLNHQKTGTIPTQNIGQDNKAKGPCLPQVTNTKREQQDCREVPKRGCANHEVCDAHELWW
jgi:hypothetical protein